MNPTLILGTWQQFCDTLEELGYLINCRIDDEGPQWTIYANKDGRYKTQFSLYRYPEYWLFAPVDVERFVRCENAKDARRAAYEWLLSRHCLIGMAVGA